MTRTRSVLTSALIGLPLAIGIGALAATFNPGPFLVTMLVFTLVTLPAACGVGVVALSRSAAPEYHEETVEHRWMIRATSGAFLDLVTGLGVLLAVVSVFDTEIESAATLLILILVALADVAARYTVLSRRER